MIQFLPLLAILAGAALALRAPLINYRNDVRAGRGAKHRNPGLPALRPRPRPGRRVAGVSL